MTTGAGWIDLIAAVLRDGPPRLPDRLCGTDTAQLFDGTDEADVADAVELCGRCCHQTECREWSSTQSVKRVSGVVGGELREWVEHPSRIRKARQEATHA